VSFCACFHLVYYGAKDETKLISVSSPAPTSASSSILASLLTSIMSFQAINLSFCGTLHEGPVSFGAQKEAHIGVKLHPNLLIHVATQGRFHGGSIHITFARSPSSSPTVTYSTWLRDHAAALDAIISKEEGGRSTQVKLNCFPLYFSEPDWVDVGHGVKVYAESTGRAHFGSV
jgi:hypothetical protein